MAADGGSEIRGAIDSAAVMIGNRDIDMMASRRNGLTACGILLGRGSYDELTAHHPEHLLSSTRELITLISH